MISSNFMVCQLFSVKIYNILKKVDRYSVVFFCLGSMNNKSHQIYYHFIQLMNPIKKHRRNVALQPEEDTYRHTYHYDQPETYRVSQDLSDWTSKYRCSELTGSINSNNLQLKFRKSSSPNKKQLHYEKQGSKILSSLSNLNQKLSMAKNIFGQLQKPKGNLAKSSLKKKAYTKNYPQTNQPYKNYHLQSTINLQSHEKLIKQLRSKQKFLLANKIKNYYITEIVKGVSGVNDKGLQHLVQSYQIIKAYQREIHSSRHNLPKNILNLPRSKQNMNKKVMVIDLDQTLFKSHTERTSQNDIQVSIQSKESGTQTVFISLRPYALSFLNNASKKFEVIAFTASQKDYADAILDQIDFQRKFIHHRLYREHCTLLNNQIYVKDLRVINRPLTSMFLIDNCPFSYLYQLSNGVPILPYDQGQDNELLSIQRYLQLIRKQSDVRLLNKKTFRLQEYTLFTNYDDLVNQLYINNQALKSYY